MWEVTRKGLLARKFRLLLTSISIVLGVGFVAGTFVLTDTLGHVFDNLFTQTTKGLDAAVRSPLPFKGAPQGAQPDRPPVSDDVLPVVRSVQGVAAAEGSITGYALVIGRDGKAVQHMGPPSLGVSWGRVAKLNQSLNLRSGTRPNGPGEVALDESTATTAKVRVGDQVRVVFLSVPPEVFRLTGIFKFGDAGNLAGASLAAFDPPTAQRVLNRVGQWDQIDVVAATGVSQQVVRDRVAQKLGDVASPGRYEVVTGKFLAHEQASDVKKNFQFFSTFMLIFALVALFVGAFIIYNTFSIIVAQRARELGLLRAVGASGAQVTRSVALEAFVVGLFSSVVGLGVGVLVAIVLQALLKSLGFDLPSTTPQVLPRTIAVSILLGTLITLVSALAPARRAARVPPVAALRDAATVPGSGRRRFLVGGILTGIGIVVLAVGLFGHVKSTDVPGGAGAVVGVAALLVFVGVAMLSPLAAGPAARLLGWPSVRVRGITGELARENAMRNTRRTASTAAALMIGLALVTFVSIFGASAKASFGHAVDRTNRADFLLSGKSFSGFSPQAASAIRQALPGATVVEFRPGQFQYEGVTKELIGVSGDFDKAVDIKLRPGAQLDEFRRLGALVYKDVAADHHLKVGDKIPLRFSKTGIQQVPVQGIFDDNKGLGVNFTSYLLSLRDYEANYTDQIDFTAAVVKSPGTSAAAARATVERVLGGFPNVNVKDQSQAKAAQLSQFNRVINLMYVLLALAVLIALIGIVNTLALSIYERTHELGLLRAVGMTRRQMRLMVRNEAVIIAVFGSLMGLFVGLGFGRAIVAALSHENIAFSLPVSQLVAFVVLAGLAGLGAGYFPARRAANLDVLRAIATQ